MTKIGHFLTFISRFRNGYETLDKIKIFLHNILYIGFYPINSIYFLMFKKIIIHPKFLFNNFKIKNSDGLFICRDNVDLDIVSETFEQDIRKYFKEFEKGIFVDVGANIGKYTIMISNQINNNGKIISIEPHPDNFKILKKNINLNKCKNVIPLNFACWNKKGTLKLFSHEDQPLLASAIKQSEKYVTVSAESLDNILKKVKIKNVDFVKLDVEGAESKVLEGMKTMLKSGKTKIIFEAWNDKYVNDCRKILETYNYKIKQLDKMYWLGYHDENS